MRAFMSSGPLSPATEYTYLAIVRDTPFRENAWERVAIAEARAILDETPRSDSANYYVTVAAMIPADLPCTRAMLAGPTARKVAVNRAANHGVMVLDNETAAILADALTSFLSMEIS